MAAALFVAAAGCAKMGAPPGGPVDDTAPRVVLTEPADGATGVRPPVRLAIHFSEKMNHRTVERRLSIDPEPEWVRFSWEKNVILLDSVETEVSTLVIESDVNSGGDGAPPREGDVTVALSGFSEDRHGNLFAEAPYSFTWTSADSLDAGSVSGVVTGAKADRRAPPVTVCATLPTGEGDERGETVRRGQAGKDGRFRLAHLPTTGAPLVLFAHRDDDEDGEVDYDFEYYGWSDTLRLTAETPVIDSIEVKMVNADTPASLAGTITVPFSADSVVVCLESPSDSTFLATSRLDSAGAWSFSRLDAGEYVIRAVLGDREEIEREGPDAGEEDIAAGKVLLRPGEEATGVALLQEIKRGENGQVTE